MSQKKIVILTHNPVRDPVTDDCLTVALKNRGHLVWRRSFLECDKEMIVYVNPDIVILPEIRCEYSRDYATQCRKWGIQVVVRPCEMGITEESIPLISEDYRRAIFGENWPVDDAFDLMLCWGQKMKDLFCKYGKINPDKAVVIGGIAFDQYFLPAFPEKIERTQKKRVLFATGFAYADRNPQYSMPEAKPEDPLHQEMVQIDSTARSKWFALIKRFWAEHGNDWEVWVKMHPGERVEVYQAVLRDTVTICPNYPPVRALRYADVLVHAGSTMAYEAHLMNIPAFNLNNICQDVVVSKISPNISSFEELANALQTVEFGRSNADKQITESLERDYYGLTDGKASERAAEEICKLPDVKTDIPGEWPKAKEWKYATPCILQNVEVWFCKGCGSQYHVQGPREMVKCPNCGIANVKTITQPGGVK